MGNPNAPSDSRTRSRAERGQPSPRCLTAPTRRRYTPAPSEPAPYVGEEATAADRRVSFPRPLAREAFSYLGPENGRIRPPRNRAQVAAGLGRGRRLRDPEPGRSGRRPPRRQGATCSRCSRTRRASCTWATSSTTRSATSSRTSAAAAASRCCARWATTRSACRPRTPRSARAATRATVTERNIDAIRRQIKRMGWSIDWSREVSTHEPDVLPLDAVALPQAATRPGSPTARPRRSSGARTTRPCSRTSR